MDVVRHQVADLRDKHGDTRERCSLQQFAWFVALVNNLIDLREVDQSNVLEVFNLAG